MRLASALIGGYLLLGAVGCTTLLQDPPADLVTNATPDTAQTLPPPPAVASGVSSLDVTQARKRGWVPRRATRTGDVIEGHAIEITPQALTPEVVAPAIHVPRAPKYTHTPTSPTKIRQPSGVPDALPPPETASPVSSGPGHPLLQGER